MRAHLDALALRAAQQRANRRVLPQPNAVIDVAVALASQSGGEATLVRRTF